MNNYRHQVIFGRHYFKFHKDNVIVIFMSRTENYNKALENFEKFYREFSSGNYTVNCGFTINTNNTYERVFPTDKDVAPVSIHVGNL